MLQRRRTQIFGEGGEQFSTLINSAIITVLLIALPMAFRAISLDPFSYKNIKSKDAASKIEKVKANLKTIKKNDWGQKIVILDKTFVMHESDEC